MLPRYVLRSSCKAVERAARGRHVVMVFVDGRLAMLVLPASHRVDLSRVGPAIEAREVFLAGEREIANTFSDCEVGAMPPFGNLYGIPGYVDRLLAEEETIVFQAGTHTDTISMKYADYARLVRPRSLSSRAISARLWRRAGSPVGTGWL